MSQRSTLKVAPRTASGSGPLKRLRKSGQVPGVVYGKEFPNQNIQVEAKALRDLLAHSTSEHILIYLELDGGAKPLALIQDVTHNALSDNITHVDFHAVQEDEKLHARIPLELTGEAAGLKLGGLLEHLVHTLDIHCLPKDLPEKISYDVSALEIGQSVHLRDVALPEGVSARLGGDVIVALMAAPRVSEEPAAAAEAKAEGKAAKGKGKK